MTQDAVIVPAVTFDTVRLVMCASSMRSAVTTALGDGPLLFPNVSTAITLKFSGVNLVHRESADYRNGSGYHAPVRD
jgi:hypothetical protein